MRKKGIGFSFVSMVILLLLSVLPVGAAQDVESTSLIASKAEEQNDLSESLEAYMEYRYNRQKHLTKWAKKRMKLLKAKLSDLEKRASKLEERSKAKWKQEVIPELKVHRDKLKLKVSELKSSSKEIWIHMKWSFGEALETYEYNLKKALAKLKKLESKKATNK